MTQSRCTSQLFVLFAEDKAITGFMNEEANVNDLKKADKRHLESMAEDFKELETEIIEDDYTTELIVDGIPLMRFIRCF